MIDSKEIIFVLVPGASQYIHGISNINLFLLFYFGSNFIKKNSRHFQTLQNAPSDLIRTTIVTINISTNKIMPTMP